MVSFLDMVQSNGVRLPSVVTENVTQPQIGQTIAFVVCPAATKPGPRRTDDKKRSSVLLAERLTRPDGCQFAAVNHQVGQTIAFCGLSSRYQTRTTLDRRQKSIVCPTS
jgi:hypothetical protein